MKKTKFNKKELKLFSNIIASRIAETKEQLSSVQGLLKSQKAFKKSKDLKNDIDNSVTRNTEILKSMKRNSKIRLQKLQDAVKRIKAKTYGRCLKTGKMISKKRLLAMPEATTVISL